jgi:hypothetical protein
MSIADKITENKSLLGLDCLLSSEGDPVYSAIWLKKTASKIISEKAVEGIASLEAIPGMMKDKPPVILVLNGKGIIHKQISWNESDDERTILGKILPNASLTDFYLQKSASFNGRMLVSAARRSLVDPILDKCAENKLEIIGCSFGPIVMENMLSLLEAGEGYQYEFSFSEYVLSVVDNRLENFKTAQPLKEGSVKIGEETISFSSLIPFAAVFTTLAGMSVPEAGIDRTIAQRQENNQKRLFYFALSSMVGFFLLVMLINFFVFDHYRSKKEHLEQQLAQNHDVIQKLDTLTVEFQRKQAFLERTGMLEASRVSSYADDLGRDMPLSILLSGMNINPFLRPKTEEDKISFEKKIIHLTGVCNHSIELNDWMQEIKKKNWVKNLVLLNYSLGKGMQAGEFSLQMEIR